MSFGNPPFYDEFYWTNSSIGSESTTEWTLSKRERKASSSRKQFIFYPNVYPSKKHPQRKVQTLRAKLKLSLAALRKECSVKELNIIRPEATTDIHSKFRVIVENIEFEKAAVLGDVCARIMKKRTQ